MKNLLNRVLSIGLNEEVAPVEERYIRFTNLEALLTVIGVVLYVLYSVFTGNYLLSAIQGIDAVLILSVLWLNHKQYYKTARVVFLFILNSVILIDACFIGKQSGVDEFFYISYTIPFLLFNVRDYKYIVTGVLFAILAFSAYPFLYLHFTAYNPDVATQLNIFRINTWMIFILFGGAVYVLAYYNYLTENRLAESNKKLTEQAVELKRSNEDLEQFGYIISHDLKAPVRNISSFMSLLGKQFGETFPMGTKELVDMSKQSADRLAKQIDDMLSYCRVDRNLPPAASVDLNQLIRTIQMELNEKIKQRNAEIIIERELPVLEDVHATLMHHIFQNLIANGIKFNTTVKPEVRINYSEQNGILTFSIADNGIGIDAAYKSKLFQMFKRLHTSEQFDGTGIGLAVCKKIINFYKGEIWFESEPGKGTTFLFTLNKLAIKLTPKIFAPVPVSKAA